MSSRLKLRVKHQIGLRLIVERMTRYTGERQRLSGLADLLQSVEEALVSITSFCIPGHGAGNPPGRAGARGFDNVPMHQFRGGGETGVCLRSLRSVS